MPEISPEKIDKEEEVSRKRLDEILGDLGENFSGNYNERKKEIKLEREHSKLEREYRKFDTIVIVFKNNGNSLLSVIILLFFL